MDLQSQEKEFQYRTYDVPVTNLSIFVDHKLRPPRHNLNSMTQKTDKFWLTRPPRQNLNSMTQKTDKSWLTLNFRHV